MVVKTNSKIKNLLISDSIETNQSVLFPQNKLIFFVLSFYQSFQAISPLFAIKVNIIIFNKLANKIMDYHIINFP